MKKSISLAYFISSHGFGHAARACAVMTALQHVEPSLRFEIFSKVPPWFFERSLPGAFSYHDLWTDVGVAQHNSLNEDLPQTIYQLEMMKTFITNHEQRLAGEIKHLGCRLVLCDIAPMGLTIAQSAGVPGVLIENFTWDWIYEGYEALEPRFSPFITYLQKMFAAASYHICTEPVCRPHLVDLTTLPVSRPPRTPAAQIRRRLGLPDQARLVLVTMGGVGLAYPFLEKLENMPGVYFLVAGASRRQERRGNLILLPSHSEFYHPDLVNACDVIVGKAGYSTLAEAYHAGVPFGYVARARFRESASLTAYIDSQMPGRQITETQFLSGDWLSILPELLVMPRVQRAGPNGAGQVADFITGLLGSREGE